MKACEKAFRMLVENGSRETNIKKDIEPEKRSIGAPNSVVHNVVTDPEESQAYEHHYVA
jgi:hypothetical protein